MSEGLNGALADVSTGEEAPSYFSWVDTAALREIGDLPPSTEEVLGNERWSVPVGLALGPALVDLAGTDAVDVGFDPLADERTVAVGVPPADATRYDGVDVEAGAAAFGELGYERVETDAGEFLALGGEGEVVTEAIDELGGGPVGINRVAIEAASLALGGYEAPVAAALGNSGEPLADDAAFAATADCLGEASFAATITDPAEGAAAEEVAAIGVGLPEPEAGSADVPEVVCAAGAPEGALDATAKTMEDAFNGGGRNPIDNEPFARTLGEATIERGELDGTPWVRATFRPPAGDERVGVVFTLLEQGALTAPFGGISPLTSEQPGEPGP